MQTTDHVLMIRPARFTSNPETASSNAFQSGGLAPDLAQAAAQREFDTYVSALQDAGVGVLVVDDTPQPHTPDSIFPNNWISLHADGRVFLYPMEAHNRRMERRAGILSEIGKQFRISDIVDLCPFETRERFLEGTGSMVLDHLHKIAYVCHSSRSHPDAMKAFEEHSGYRAVWFRAVDRHGKPIYHTNVMMCVGTSLAVVCMESLLDAHERAMLGAALRESGKTVMEISYAQMESFAGNMLELRSRHGNRVLAMSRRAWRSLAPVQQEQIAAYAEPVRAPIETIERLGGGSARCMLAEIFLPRMLSQNPQDATRTAPATMALPKA